MYYNEGAHNPKHGVSFEKTLVVTKSMVEQSRRQPPWSIPFQPLSAPHPSATTAEPAAVAVLGEDGDFSSNGSATIATDCACVPEKKKRQQHLQQQQQHEEDIVQQPYRLFNPQATYYCGPGTNYTKTLLTGSEGFVARKVPAAGSYESHEKPSDRESMQRPDPHFPSLSRGEQNLPPTRSRFLQGSTRAYTVPLRTNRHAGRAGRAAATVVPRGNGRNPRSAARPFGRMTSYDFDETEQQRERDMMNVPRNEFERQRSLRSISTTFDFGGEDEATAQLSMDLNASMPFISHPLRGAMERQRSVRSVSPTALFEEEYLHSSMPALAFKSIENNAARGNKLRSAIERQRSVRSVSPTTLFEEEPSQQPTDLHASAPCLHDEGDVNHAARLNKMARSSIERQLSARSISPTALFEEPEQHPTNLHARTPVLAYGIAESRAPLGNKIRRHNMERQRSVRNVSPVSLVNEPARSTDVNSSSKSSLTQNTASDADTQGASNPAASVERQHSCRSLASNLFDTEEDTHQQKLQKSILRQSSLRSLSSKPLTNHKSKMDVGRQHSCRSLATNLVDTEEETRQQKVQKNILRQHSLRGLSSKPLTSHKSKMDVGRQHSCRSLASNLFDGEDSTSRQKLQKSILRQQSLRNLSSEFLEADAPSPPRVDLNASMPVFIGRSGLTIVDDGADVDDMDIVHTRHEQHMPCTAETLREEFCKQRSMIALHNIRKSVAREVEILPGVFCRLRGASETWQAIKEDFYKPCSCECCDLKVFCIRDADFVKCPHCREVTQVSMHMDNGGLALGFKASDLINWKQDIVQERRALNAHMHRQE